MTGITFYDRTTGRYKPFNLTPRRKQILWHIAYTNGVRVRMVPNHAGGRHYGRVPNFFLDGTNINDIVILLKKCRLVDFHFGVQPAFLHLKPLGMQVLLESVS